MEEENSTETLVIISKHHGVRSHKVTISQCLSYLNVKRFLILNTNSIKESHITGTATFTNLFSSFIHEFSAVIILVYRYICMGSVVSALSP